jgi:ABC-type transporter Mla MlaB component
MATKDNNAGLLSKVAKFVRNPTKDWSELDKPEPEQESGYSKLALKEIIERKRQNDFVRRREFDHLRKLRRDGPVTAPDRTERASFFNTSTPSNLDERATTLKKIDEIEAQMSKQWWKGRQDAAAAQVTQPPDALTIKSNLPSAQGVPSADGASSFSPTQAFALSAGSELSSEMDYASTQMGEAVPYEPNLASDSPPEGVFNAPGSRNFEAGMSEFSSARLFSTELVGSQADPEMEEAAIRFANSDDTGAQACLLDALRGDNVTPEAADRWAGALFDLYRATGQQAPFDDLALDHAVRFGRSAPAWTSIPELLGRASEAPRATSMAAASVEQSSTWHCPAVLDAAAVQRLQATVSSGPGPWHLNWSALRSIEPQAAAGLSALVARWCQTPVTLHVVGMDLLHQALNSFSASGDRQADMAWWQLRLDTLRLLGLQDEFELAALDYCVAYEVSPPPWLDTRCALVREAGSDPRLERPAAGVALSASGDPTQALTVPMGLAQFEAAEAELTGELLGDAADALDALHAGLHNTDRMVISCTRLIRVDFSAAGSILNWVAEREAEGCRVQFRDVPRLVGTFFNVIGINEHARVILRTS